MPDPKTGFNLNLPADLAAGVAYVEQAVAEARQVAERDALGIYNLTADALHHALHPCNCCVVWNPFTEGHVWQNGTIDGACGHPATGTPYVRPAEGPTL